MERYHTLLDALLLGGKRSARDAGLPDGPADDEDVLSGLESLPRELLLVVLGERSFRELLQLRRLSQHFKFLIDEDILPAIRTLAITQHVEDVERPLMDIITHVFPRMARLQKLTIWVTPLVDKSPFLEALASSDIAARLHTLVLYSDKRKLVSFSQNVFGNAHLAQFPELRVFVCTCPCQLSWSAVAASKLTNLDLLPRDHPLTILAIHYGTFVSRDTWGLKRGTMTPCPRLKKARFYETQGGPGSMASVSDIAYFLPNVTDLAMALTREPLRLPPNLESLEVSVRGAPKHFAFIGLVKHAETLRELTLAFETDRSKTVAGTFSDEIQACRKLQRLHVPIESLPDLNQLPNLTDIGLLISQSSPDITSLVIERAARITIYGYRFLPRFIRGFKMRFPDAVQLSIAEGDMSRVPERSFGTAQDIWWKSFPKLENVRVLDNIEYRDVRTYRPLGHIIGAGMRNPPIHGLRLSSPSNWDWGNLIVELPQTLNLLLLAIRWAELRRPSSNTAITMANVMPGFAHLIRSKIPSSVNDGHLTDAFNVGLLFNPRNDYSPLGSWEKYGNWVWDAPYAPWTAYQAAYYKAMQKYVTVVDLRKFFPAKGRYRLPPTGMDPIAFLVGLKNVQHVIVSHAVLEAHPEVRSWIAAIEQARNTLQAKVEITVTD